MSCGNGSTTTEATTTAAPAAKEEAAGHDHDGHDHAGHDHSGHSHEGHSHDGHNHDGHNHGTAANCHTGKGTAYESAYVCPMHCEGSGSDKAGTCPACKMDYVALADHAKDGHTH